MTAMSLPKLKFVTYQDKDLYSKRLREGYKNDSMLLCTKVFCDQLKSFLLRIRANFNGNPSRNKKATVFD